MREHHPKDFIGCHLPHNGQWIQRTKEMGDHDGGGNMYAFIYVGVGVVVR